jgi:hypothetical protein
LGGQQNIAASYRLEDRRSAEIEILARLAGIVGFAIGDAGDVPEVM